MTGSKPALEYVSFSSSLTSSTGGYVQTVAPNGAGTTRGMPNTCQGGVGVGATTYSVPIPMPPLRQN